MPAYAVFVLRRLSILLLAPVLALTVLLAWAVSSPVGSSPDDDFHLVSIWCASPASSEVCQTTAQDDQRLVPESLTAASCYAFDATTSAACQDPLTFEATADTLTVRGNFAGGYPPIYYATMGLVAGNDIALSAVLMRVLNIVLFVGLATALYLLLPVRRRPTLVWSWVLTTVPLGLFLLSSTNPSAWAITGVGLGWLALLGYFETAGWRKVGLAVVFTIAAVMAAGSRSDAAMYTVLGIAAVVLLTAKRSRRWLVSALLPAAVAVFCFALFRLSRPVASLTQGLPSGGGDGGAAQPTDLFGLVAYNLLQGPSLWTGIFGDEWGLGWLDTSMPAAVWFSALACFLAVGFLAIRSLSWRKLIVVLGGVLTLWLLPTVVLVAAGESVGQNMQPRYLLPLVVLFTGVLMLRQVGRPLTLTRVQVFLIVGGLSVAQFIALNLNLRRYVTGFDNLGLSLDSGIEWWWGGPISPNVVWIVGSLAFTALLLVLLPRHAGTITSRQPVTVAVTASS